MDPFVIDGLPIRWYAVMYLVAFFVAYLVFRYGCRHDGVIDISDDEGQDFFISAIIGLLIGARLFSVFFFNAELFGRVTTLPWGMVFPTAERFPASEPWVQEVADKVGMPWALGEMVNLPRHPSQLYEALFEGVVLFLLLWFVARPLKYRKKLPDGTVFCFYLMGYGIFRFFIEYCRQPDAHIGYVIAGGPGAGNIALFQSFLNISEGQVFCLIMIAAGAVFFALLMAGRRYDNRGKAAGPKGKAQGRRPR